MKKKKNPIKDTTEIVTANIIGVTGMQITHDIGSTLPGPLGQIAGTHTPTMLGLGLLSGTARYAQKQAKK